MGSGFMGVSVFVVITALHSNVCIILRQWTFLTLPHSLNLRSCPYACIYFKASLINSFVILYWGIYLAEIQCIHSIISFLLCSWRKGSIPQKVCVAGMLTAQLCQGVPSQSPQARTFCTHLLKPEEQQ